jgi:hypothetical protein
MTRWLQVPITPPALDATIGLIAGIACALIATANMIYCNWMFALIFGLASFSPIRLAVRHFRTNANNSRANSGTDIEIKKAW